jgi:hypothetical protein
VQPPPAVCAAFSTTERLDTDAVAANRPTSRGIVPNLHAMCVRHGEKVKFATKIQLQGTAATELHLHPQASLKGM